MMTCRDLAKLSCVNFDYCFLLCNKALNSNYAVGLYELIINTVEYCLHDFMNFNYLCLLRNKN